jgi:hypothetical protein
MNFNKGYYKTRPHMVVVKRRCGLIIFADPYRKNSITKIEV